MNVKPSQYFPGNIMHEKHNRGLGKERKYITETGKNIDKYFLTYIFYVGSNL